MIYKGKGKRTRFRRCRRSSWLHRYYGGGYISRRRKQWKNLTRLFGDAKHLSIYLFFVCETNLEFIFIIKFIERPIENAKLSDDLRMSI